MSLAQRRTIIIGRRRLLRHQSYDPKPRIVSSCDTLVSPHGSSRGSPVSAKMSVGIAIKTWFPLTLYIRKWLSWFRCFCWLVFHPVHLCPKLCCSRSLQGNIHLHRCCLFPVIILLLRSRTHARSGSTSTTRKLRTLFSTKKFPGFAKVGPRYRSIGFTYLFSARVAVTICIPKQEVFNEHRLEA